MEKKEVDIAIINALILCLDDVDTIIEDGTLLIKDGNIISIGKFSDLENTYISIKTIHAKNKLLMPGLINTHTHSTMSIFRGFADDLRLEEWLSEHIWPVESVFVNPENVYLGTQLSIIEMIRSGTVCFADMYFYEDEVARASVESGFRVMIGEGILDTPTSNKRTPDEAMEYTKFLLNKYKNNELVNVSLSPHAIYTCSSKNLLKIKDISEEYNIPVQIHLSETQKEFDNCILEHGKSPVAFIDNLGLLNSRLIASHCNIISEEDIDLISQKKPNISHNPQSNMKLGSGIAPVIKYLENDVCVGLGTDGAASNNNLNMFKEIGMVAKLHKVFAKDPTILDAKTAVQMATIWSAKVLGLDNITGSLEKGKKADMIIVDLLQANLVPLYNIYSHLTYSMESANVESVIVNGELLMENRELLTIDEDKVISQVLSLSKKIKSFRK